MYLTFSVNIIFEVCNGTDALNGYMYLAKQFSVNLSFIITFIEALVRPVDIANTLGIFL